MSDENIPEPGTLEYDVYMAVKFARQRAGEGKSKRTNELTGTEEKADSYRDVPETDGKLRIHKESAISPPDVPEYYSKELADPGQVIDLEQRIAKLRAELDEVRRYDAQSGQPIYKYEGEARRAREIDVVGLERELPLVREMQRRAANWRAKNVPTPEQDLLAEKARGDAIRKRAQELADEEEARAESERILAERRSQGR
jgi:hypothetical protein